MFRIAKEHPGRVGLAALTALVAFHYVWGLGGLPLLDWDENMLAEASRQMLERGNFLRVYVNDYAYAEKPPFFFWAQALSFWLFGVGEFAARLPSALAGLATMLLVYRFGRWLHSARFGLLWAMAYATALAPSLLGRFGLVDATFNMFITLSVGLLYRFDTAYGHWRQDPRLGRRGHWTWLVLASLAMGLGVLTKGPLGGAVPVFAFGVYKLFYRRPPVAPAHFLACAGISLGLASSWYLINAALYGIDFLMGFIRIQAALFSRPLEGHAWPFFFHFIAVPILLLPWTPVLFATRRGGLAASPKIRQVGLLAVAWSAFVLTVMSLVSTKLPHYSSSVYVPFALWVAVVLEDRLAAGIALPRPVVAALAVLALGFGAFVYFVPEVVRRAVVAQGFVYDPPWPPLLLPAALAVSAALLVGAVWFWRGRMVGGICATAIGVVLFTQSFWIFHLPPVARLIQGPVVEMVRSLHDAGERVVFYRYVSFAALFYGRQPITMLYTYKFPGDPSILDRRHEKDVYVLTRKRFRARLLADHPLVEHVEDRGNFGLFRLPARRGGEAARPVKP